MARERSIHPHLIQAVLTFGWSMLSAPVMSSNRGWVLVALFVGCGGGHASSASPTAASTSAPQGPPAQCHVLSDRFDTLNRDIGRVDAKTPDGIQSLASTFKVASADVDAMHFDGDLSGIAHDSAAQLTAASQSMAEMGTIVTRITATAATIKVDTIKTCVIAPSRAIGVACAGKMTTGDCKTVMDALDAWAHASGGQVNNELRHLRQLTVTEPAVKPRVADIVKCIAPMGAALDAMERDQARLKEIAFDDKPEQALDARFKAICGRALFNRP